jgi:opacity protein-like surface antigen
MPHRSQTRKIAAVLAALAVVAMIAAAAYQLGHDTSGAGPSGTGTSSTAPSGFSPSPAPASPSTGSSQPGLPQGPARAGEGGRMTGPAGLPLGYDHTDTGAIQAATNYLTWMNSIRIKDKTTADAMAKATAVDESTRTAMVDSFDELRTGLDHVSNSQTEVTRGAYAVPEFGPARASVYIWAPYVLTDTSGKTVTAWGSSRFR